MKKQAAAKPVTQPTKVARAAKFNLKGMTLVFGAIDTTRAAQALAEAALQQSKTLGQWKTAAHKYSAAGVTRAMLTAPKKKTEKSPNPVACPEYIEGLHDSVLKLITMGVSKNKGVQHFKGVPHFVGESTMPSPSKSCMWTVEEMLAVNDAQRRFIASLEFKGVLDNLKDEINRTTFNRFLSHLDTANGVPKKTREAQTDEGEEGEKSTGSEGFDLRTRPGVLGVLNGVNAQLLQWCGASEKDAVENKIRELIMLIMPK